MNWTIFLYQTTVSWPLIMVEKSRSVKWYSSNELIHEWDVDGSNDWLKRTAESTFGIKIPSVSKSFAWNHNRNAYKTPSLDFGDVGKLIDRPNQNCNYWYLTTCIPTETMYYEKLFVIRYRQASSKIFSTIFIADECDTRPSLQYNCSKFTQLNWLAEPILRITSIDTSLVFILFDWVSISFDSWDWSGENRNSSFDLTPGLTGPSYLLFSAIKLSYRGRNNLHSFISEIRHCIIYRNVPRFLVVSARRLQNPFADHFLRKIYKIHCLESPPA